jgi:hypothetical protein
MKHDLHASDFKKRIAELESRSCEPSQYCYSVEGNRGPAAFGARILVIMIFLLGCL